MGAFKGGIGLNTTTNDAKVVVPNLLGMTEDEAKGYARRLNEASNGKDTMTGHWEMMGLEVKKPFQTFTEHGFPPELIKELEKQMKKAAADLNFEAAAELRDKLIELKKTLQEIKI